jgi:proton glutamate symport protein
MLDVNKPQRRLSTRAVPFFWVAGTLLWLCGLGVGTIGHPVCGVVIRWIALAAFAGLTLRGPSLMTSTLLGLFAGVEIGLDSPHFAVELRFLGDLFLRSVRMIVAPLLFATITTGIAGHSELRSVGRVAIKSLILFEVITTLGLLLGAVAIDLSGAGWGVALPSGLDSVTAPSQGVQSWQQVVVNLVPENLAQAVAQNQILQVAVFSVLFGCALALLAEKKRAPLLAVLQALADVMFQLTRIIMYLAPVAAGAAIAYTVGGTGIAALLPLTKLAFTFYGSLVVFCLLVLLPILLLFRIPVGRFIQAVGEPAAIGFATTTSEAALPLAMERMEEMGVPRWIVSFVIPTGYSFNMTGSSLYLSIAALFVAQAAGIHLTLGQQATMLLILMLASKGIAGVPRAVLVVLLATASAVHLPTMPILLILGIDALMDMGRTMLNVVGNCLASAVIARSEGELLLK